jgi:hypothetical protein
VVTVAFPGPKGRVGHPDLTQKTGQIPAGCRTDGAATHLTATAFEADRILFSLMAK